MSGVVYCRRTKEMHTKLLRFARKLGRDHPLKGGRMRRCLVDALRWWREVLHLRLHQSLPLVPAASRVAELFCDARGEPPRTAAVLIDRSHFAYTDYEPDEALMRGFASRKDSQLMGLELLSPVWMIE